MALPVDLALPQQEVPAAQEFAEGLITLWQATKTKLERLQAKEKIQVDRARRESGIN